MFEEAKDIDLTDPEQIRYWRGAFGCTEEELIAAVKIFGTDAQKVRDYFDGLGPIGIWQKA